MVSLLNPRDSEIKKCIENNIKDKGFIVNHLYVPCVKALKRENIKTIKEETIHGPIKMFLINWGRMGRVLESESREDWEADLEKIIKEKSGELEKFRRLKLEYTDITKMETEKEIRVCYKSIRKLIGPTAASKTLHIICPSFFPLWDQSIRGDISKECRASGQMKQGIGSSDKGYYNFMKVTKVFLKKYNHSLSGLCEKYGRSKLKIIDEYFFKSTRR